MNDFDIEYHLRELEEAAGTCASGIGSNYDTEKPKHAIRTEMDRLREAVKLLGQHIQTLTAERAIFSQGPGLNEWAYAKVAVEESGDRVRNNPIAAAAVRGEP